MYQFFISSSQISQNKIYIEGDDYNHIKNVLRMKKGEELNVVTEEGIYEYRCEIESFDDARVNLTVRFKKESDVELPNKIYLFQGLVKSDKLELIIQKSVELGVFEITPVILKRCVAKPDKTGKKSKAERWNKISEAAAKQSKRRIIPKVSEPLSIDEALNMCKNIDIKLIPYELCDFNTMDITREIFYNINLGQSIAIFIGPEGGFDEGELMKAKEAGFKEITLGHRILRTETAGPMVLSWLTFLLDKERGEK